MMNAYIRWILRYRLIVLIFLSLLTIAFGISASRGVFSSSFGALAFGEDHEEYNRYVKRIQEFASDGVFIISYADDNMLSTGSIARLEKAVAHIETIPEVHRVDSLLNAQHIAGQDDVLYINRYVDDALEQPEDTEQLFASLNANPLYRELLISEDGRYSAVIVELEPDDSISAERLPAIIKAAVTGFERAGFARNNLHVIGITMTIAELVNQSALNLSRLFPLGCLLLLLILYVLFRRLWPVLLTLVVSLIGVIWTYGFAVLLDPRISIFDSIAPIIILIVATSDIIHLCSAYLLELAQGLPKDKAILRSGTEVGTACFWTSATTFVGFVALVFVPVPAFKRMGIVTGFGVAGSLLLAMTLCPILFSLLKTPHVDTYSETAPQRALSSLLQTVERWTFRHPWSIIALFGVVGCGAVVGISKLHIETNFNERFSKQSRFSQDLAFYRSHFAGENFLEIFLDVPEPEGLLDPHVFSRIEAFQQAVRQLPGVENVVSMVDLIQIIDRELNPKPGAESWTRELLAQYLLLFEMSGGEDLDRFINFDRTSMRLAARLADTRSIETYQTALTITEMAETMLPDTVRAEATGFNYLVGGFLEDLIRGQRRGLVFALGTIAIMMMLMFRSFKLGAWAMIPNILPLVVLGCVAALWWDRVDSDIIVIFMIAVGIGVDDTIHFLSRLRFESSRTPDPNLALQRTFHFSGRAMATTTIILAAGFLPLALSSYFSIMILGTLLPLTLIVALSADILLVPALVKVGAIRFPSAPSETTTMNVFQPITE